MAKVNRASLVASIPLLLKMMRGAASNASSGQSDLFAARPEPALKLVEVPEWSLDETLYYERKSTGTYFSGHPTHAAKAKYHGQITQTCESIKRFIDYGTHEDIVVCGLVTGVWPRRVVTIIQLEDETGRVDCLLSRDNANRFQFLLQRDYILLARLRVMDGDREGFDVTKLRKVGHFNPV